MSANLAAIGYLVAAVCFILALRGLSSPASSRMGNRYGMAGMVLAVLTTLLALPHAGVGGYLAILVAIGLGGATGYTVAQRIQMTAMPQLVAAFHSLVGLAAVFVAAGAFLEPQEFAITRPDGPTSPTPATVTRPVPAATSTSVMPADRPLRLSTSRRYQAPLPRAVRLSALS